GAFHRVDARRAKIRRTGRDIFESGAVLIRPLSDGFVLQPRYGRHAFQYQSRSCRKSKNALSRTCEFRRHGMGFDAVVCTDVPRRGKIWRDDASVRAAFPLLRRNTRAADRRAAVGAISRSRGLEHLWPDRGDRGYDLRAHGPDDFGKIFALAS